MANPNTTSPDLLRYTCNVSLRFDKATKKPVETRPITLLLDFTGVSRSQLISEATRNIVVGLQGAARSATKLKVGKLTWDQAVAKINGKTLKVSEILSKTRTRVTPEVKRSRIVADAHKDGEDTVKALIADLQKSLAGRK